MPSNANFLIFYQRVRAAIIITSNTSSYYRTVAIAMVDKVDTSAEGKYQVNQTSYVPENKSGRCCHLLKKKGVVHNFRQ
jgi:hypothetical protein